jgi:hypothetical protein
MQNLSKSHEKNVQTAVHTEQVDSILSNVENVPYALRGSMVKSVLYWLFCLIAALELSAALFFYVASLGTPQAVAAVGAAAIGFLFHSLLHSILTDTTKGMVFSKKRESKAMSAEVVTNIVLSIVLLIMAACTVYFMGKKGFTAYRATAYEKKQDESKPVTDKPLGITADMLVNKKGKISEGKLEQLAAVTTAQAKATDSKTASVTADRQAYDSSTANVTDIVGASAFVLELLLALLAYSIATAKYAAVFDEIARRNKQQGEAQNVENTQKSNEKASVTANVEANQATSHTDQEPPPQTQKRIGFQPQTASGNEGRTVIKGFAKNSTTASVEANVTANVERPTPPPNTKVCQWCDEYFVYSIHNQKYCCEDCRIAAYQDRSGKTLVKGKKK